MPAASTSLTVNGAELHVLQAVAEKEGNFLSIVVQGPTEDDVNAALTGLVVALDQIPKREWAKVANCTLAHFSCPFRLTCAKRAAPLRQREVEHARPEFLDVGGAVVAQHVFDELGGFARIGVALAHAGFAKIGVERIWQPTKIGAST